jgi:hypothetical protein
MWSRSQQARTRFTWIIHACHAGVLGRGRVNPLLSAYGDEAQPSRAGTN